MNIIAQLKKIPNLILTFKQSTEDTSWGKVFAFCLRHKELAKKCGFIHEELKIDLDDNTYQNGGWLYVDLHPDCSYFTASASRSEFHKKICGTHS